jgi:hypothetical protein
MADNIRRYLKFFTGVAEDIILHPPQHISAHRESRMITRGILVVFNGLRTKKITPQTETEQA